MTERHEALPTGNPLKEALARELRPTIVDRLRQVMEHSGLSAREILAQAIDFAWDVMLSGELEPPAGCHNHAQWGGALSTQPMHHEKNAAPELRETEVARGIRRLPAPVPPNLAETPPNAE